MELALRLSAAPAHFCRGKTPRACLVEANVVACVLDMVMAGTETTAATL